MKPNSASRVSDAGTYSRPLVGLRPGTVILTKDGEIPVEYLSAQDRIITRDTGYVALDRLTRQRGVTRAVRVAPGVLGKTDTDPETLLPAAQRVFLRDWRAAALTGATQGLIAIGQLVDGEFICDVGLRRMELFCLHFARSHIIYADGIELASARPDNNALRKVA